MVHAEACLPSAFTSPSASTGAAPTPARSRAPSAPARVRDRLAARVARGVIERVLDIVDVRLGAARPWDIDVLDERFFLETLLRGSMGLGEAYMAGWWRCGDLEELSRRLLSSDLEERFRFLPSYALAEIGARARNQQTLRLSRRVADEHYSMDNDLFCRFLGRYKMYSAGYFAGKADPDDLDEAQRRKLDLICRKMELSPRDRVLDVGGGWGEFARYAAETYGCRVTSINIADEQIRYAREYCKGLPVEIVKRDYRELEGRYDKIAAIAMIAHVGPKNLRTFLGLMREHLAPGGLLFLESTGNAVSRTHMDPWVDRYIFRGATFPSIAQISAAAEGRFVVDDWHNFAMSYPPTLRAWNRNFQASWPVLGARYPEETRRMFEYFFLVGAGAFHARQLQYWHIVMTPPTRPQPGPRLT